jgi:hypothetical protein
MAATVIIAPGTEYSRSVKAAMVVQLLLRSGGDLPLS